MNRKKLNILIHIGDSYPNESPCAKRMRTLVEQLVKEGHNVIVMAPVTAESDSKIENVVYCSTIKMKKKTTIYRLLNSLVYAINSLLHSFTIGKIDIVITSSPPPLISVFGWMIAKIKGAKLVYDVRDVWPDVAWEIGSFGPESFYSKVFQFIRDFMLKHSDLVTAVSPGKVTKLQAYAPAAHVVEVMNGLDEGFLNNSENSEIVKKYQLREDSFTCVYIGNLGLAQGLKQLMYIAERAKANALPVRFLLFGSGAEEQSLKQYVQEHSLDNVTFPGRLPGTDMYTLLRHAKMSFVSLVNENLKDSIPTKLYEALGAGCPVLLAAVGDSADVLNDCKLGIAVKPNDNEALWETFLTMYEHMPEIEKNRGFATQQVLSKYSRQKAAIIFQDYLYELVNYK